MNIDINELLPFLIPLVLLQMALMVTALIMIFRQQTFKYFSRAVWVIIVLFLNIIGPVFYFVMERR